MSSIGERLRSERSRIGLTQAQMAERLGVSLRTQLAWEKGDSTPNAEHLALAAQAGADVQFVVSGLAEIEEIRTSKVVAREPTSVYGRGPPVPDRQRLARALAAVAEGLAGSERTLPPERYADLVLATYDLIADPAATPGQVVKLIRAVA